MCPIRYLTTGVYENRAIGGSLGGLQWNWLSLLVVDCHPVPGVGVCDDHHDPPVEVVDIDGGESGAPGGVGVEGAHYGEVDGEHVGGELCKVPPRAREGGEEMVLEGYPVTAHAPPEEK